MTDAVWLHDDQQRAWRSLAAVILKLPSELEAQLQRDSGMTHFEYWVLALLSEADDRRLPLSDLAGQANASLSRLSHVVTRLEKKGWVTRTRSGADARVTLAMLTAEGMTKVTAAAPGHVAAVRSLVFDGLDDRGVADLRRVCDAILTGIDGT
ncbi:MarR family winged helix-turn-helix transcriptional regulator [soil metagenome]